MPMRKAAILIVIFMMVGILGLAVVMWTSFNERDEAAVPGDILATKAAELRSPRNFSRHPESGNADLESAPSVTPTLTPEER